jgi:predicted transcriptional regulator
MIDDAILLSIKPEFAEKILTGIKTVELRRVPPRVNAGSLVVLYVSSPVKAVVGAFWVDRVVTGTPEELWPIVEEAAGLTRSEFEAYYAGTTKGVGIFVRESWSAEKPFELDEFRRNCPEFRPPQSYRYLSSMGEHAPLLLESLGMGSGHGIAAV